MMNRFFGLLLMLASSVALAVPAAYVHEITGAASAVTKGQSRSLAVGGLLESGDMIAVAKGVLTIKFEDGQIIVLQENSRFAIENYNYNKTKVADSNVVMSLLAGSMRFITGVIGGSRRDAIALRAGTATIGIRGTDLAVNIAGVDYVVTVQDGAVVLSLPNNSTSAVNSGQGATGNTNQPAKQAQPVGSMPKTVLTLVSSVTASAIPGTNPVGVAEQAKLVATVEKAKRAGEAASKPDATPDQKKAAVDAANEVKAALVTALQATQTAIQQALNAGAPAAAAQGSGAKSGGAPGVQPQPTLSEVQQIIQQVNRNLPPGDRLPPPPAEAILPVLTTEQQAALLEQQQLLNTVLTCGGAGQSPC
jgi:hypothetical protein